MFVLKNKETGELAQQRLTPGPFRYSSRALAMIGKRALEADRKEQYTVIKER